MNKVVELFKDKKEKFEIEYLLEDDIIVAITHPNWPFRIQEKDGEIAIVDETTNEPFGILDKEVFNTILISWLLISDPQLVDMAAGNEE